MIRPEVFAIESKRSTRKRNRRQVCDRGHLLTQIKLRNRPALAVLFGSAQDLDRSIDKCVAGNLRTDINRAQNVALGVQS